MTPISTRPSIGGDALQGRQRASAVRHRYWEAVLKDGPVLFWPLNEPPGATVAKDWSGHGYGGAVAVGHQTLVFGEPGYTSDGATALAQTSDAGGGDNPAAVGSTDISLIGVARPITIVFSASSVSSVDNGNIVTVGQFDTGGNVWFIFAGPLGLAVSVRGGTWRYTLGIDASGPIMHRYAISYHGSGAPILYVDATARPAPVVQAAPAPHVDLPGVFVSGDPSGGDDGRMTVADVAIFDFALSAAQNAAHVAAR